MKASTFTKCSYVFLFGVSLFFISVILFVNWKSNQRISNFKKGLNSIQIEQLKLNDRLEYQDYKAQEIIKQQDQLDQKIKEVRRRLREK